MRLTSLTIAAVLTLAACAPVEPVETPGLRRCSVEGARALIGSHVGAVSFAADADVRVVCTTCPTTRDFRPDRLNVRFDQESGVIESVDCG